jgi:hypothetical protein
VLIDSAAGIVIALLIAFSLIALGAAATMLAASHGGRRPAAPARHRRAARDRASRARGSPAEHAWRATRTGALAGALGIAIGAIAVRGAAGRLLEALNEQPPGWALVVPLAGALLAIVGGGGRGRGVARVAGDGPPHGGPCCGAPRSRARGACASAGASRRSGRGSPWPAAGAPQRASRCWR